MSKLSQIFQQTKPFIGYLTAGDGGIDYTLDCAPALIQGGVHILEIGFPFSDPVADNPEVQLSHDRALAQNLTSTTLLKIIEGIRDFNREIPLLLYSYYNPLLQRGLDYLYKLKDAGIDGVCIIDLPVPQTLSEKDPFFENLLEVGLDPILLITAKTSQERCLLTQRYARGFLYCSPHEASKEDFVEQFKKVREHFNIPVVVRKDVFDKEEAWRVLDYSDGFIVKTAFIRQITNDSSMEGLVSLARSIDPS
ncbi:tryptophan synthase subunit alpha [Chlamydia suis]|uniref:tryptophan synthase subunit alpha n=1 Tax=Chlamydia suis TaxID=83559 RepID=UPI0009B09DB2|nr:tryptophan synthase subunit alpha [Chlamydia suis]